MNKIFFSYLILLIMLIGCSKNEQVLMYVGTYTNGDSEGIYSYQFNQETGELTKSHTTIKKENPSFLAISPNKQYLYAVSEVKESPGIDSGSVTAYRIVDEGKLEKINQEATKGYHPCHVAVSPDGSLVVASNYSSGSLSLYHADEAGKLSESFQLIQHVGSGPDSSRQMEPHAHSALFDSTGELLISADLGTDKLELYTQSAGGNFVAAKQEFVAMKPGAGPRHFAFSPDGEFMYVMNEMDVTVTTLKKEAGKYREVETVSALLDGFEEGYSGADIHVSADDRFLYSSNRGHNSIAVFQRDQVTGQLTLIQNESVQGDWPRNFALSPNGEFLLVANQKSHNVTVFRINDQSGELDFTGKSIEVPSPVCLKFL